VIFLLACVGVKSGPVGELIDWEWESFSVIQLPADKTKELLMPQFTSVRMVLYLISSLI